MYSCLTPETMDIIITVPTKDSMMQKKESSHSFIPKQTLDHSHVFQLIPLSIPFFQNILKPSITLLLV